MRPQKIIQITLRQHFQLKLIQPGPCVVQHFRTLQTFQFENLLSIKMYIVFTSSPFKAFIYLTQNRSYYRILIEIVEIKTIIGVHFKFHIKTFKQST